MTTDKEALSEEEQAMTEPGTEPPPVDEAELEEELDDQPLSPEEQAMMEPEAEPELSPAEGSEIVGTPVVGDSEPTTIVDQGGSWDDRWSDIQVHFVDDPQSSVSQADELVTEVLDEVTNILRQERARMEDHWHTGVDPSTEDLRQTLQEYRAFFDRLLAA